MEALSTNAADLDSLLEAEGPGLGHAGMVQRRDGACLVEPGIGVELPGQMRLAAMAEQFGFGA